MAQQLDVSGVFKKIADLEKRLEQAEGKKKDAPRIQNDIIKVKRADEEEFLNSIRPSTEFFFLGTKAYSMAPIEEVRDDPKSRIITTPGVAVKFTKWIGAGADFKELGIAIQHYDFTRCKKINITEEDIEKFRLPKDTRLRDTGVHSLTKVMQRVVDIVERSPDLYTGEDFQAKIRPLIKAKWASQDQLRLAQSEVRKHSGLDLLRGAVDPEKFKTEPEEEQEVTKASAGV